MTERVRSEVLVLKPDTCSNTYGVSPCTAGRMDTGTAQAGTATTLTLRAGASAVNDAFNGMTARLTDGTGRERTISDYVGATKVATVERRWPTNQIKYSNDWTGANWNGPLTAVAAGVSGPYGAPAFNLTNAGFNSYRQQSLPAAVGAGEIRTFRVFIQKVSGTFSADNKAQVTLFGAAIPTTNMFIGDDLNASTDWIECVVTVTSTGAGAITASVRTDEASVIRGAAPQVMPVAAVDMQEYVATGAASVELPDATTTYDIIDRANACYNTFPSCQDEANFVRASRSDRFTGAGAPIDKTAPARPYLLEVSRAPTEIDPETGLARRSDTTITLRDEPCPDVGFDPYLADRTAAAQGTFWRRWIARNRNFSGREALLSQAYVNQGSFGTPLEERYIIDRLRESGSGGNWQLTLRDPSRRLEKAAIPATTTGRLLTALAARANAGTVAGAAAGTLTLASAASALDDTYNGMEVLITAGQGEGQRRIISDYAGASRIATLDAGWDVLPTATSSYEVHALKIQLGSGEGVQYNDPAVTLAREFVRLGEEIIEYTAISTDALTFPSSAYRAQFGSTRADHDVDDTAQQCRAWFDAAATDVIIDILLAGGYVIGEIDTAGFTAEEETWLGDGWKITACLSEPEEPGALLEELLPQLDAVTWWDPVDQLQKFKVLLPTMETATVLGEESDFIRSRLEPLDDLRATSVSINYGLADATADRDQAKNYRYGEGAADLDAISANEYGAAGPRPVIYSSRWFGRDNKIAMRAMVLRKLAARRDPPKRITGTLDPKDAALAIAQTVDIDIDAATDFTGAPQRVRCIVTRLSHRGRDLEIVARSTAFNARAAYISGNSAGDYPSDPTYAHISDNAGLMGNGDPGYVII